MHEHPEHEQPDHGAWDPSEQVGDVYAVDFDRDGQIEQIEKPAPRPQVWVGSWADYNNGILHGEWIDADQHPVELQADIDAMLTASPTALRTGLPSEEWGVFDYDGFGSLRLGEQPSLEDVSVVARGITEHGPAYAAYLAVHEGEELPTDFEASYLGHYDSADAYVEQLVEDLGYDQLLDRALPDGLAPYVHIDIAGLARDLQLGGDITVEPADYGGVWIFDPNRRRKKERLS
jgi:antirestriction protein